MSLTIKNQMLKINFDVEISKSTLHLMLQIQNLGYTQGKKKHYDENSIYKHTLLI